MNKHEPPTPIPLWNRMILILMSGLFLVASLVGAAKAIGQGEWLGSLPMWGLAAFCGWIVWLSWKYRNPTVEEYEAGLAGPLMFPDGDPIPVDTPNWLVCRFLIPRTLWCRELRFGTVAIDIDAYTIHFQNCYCPDSHGRFIPGKPLPYIEFDLSEILHVSVMRHYEDPKLTMHISTIDGRAFVPEGAVNYDGLLELLRRLTRHTEPLPTAKLPWIRRLIFGLLYVILVAVILLVLFAVT